MIVKLDCQGNQVRILNCVYVLQWATGMPVPYGADSVCGLHSPFPVRWSHLGSVTMAGNSVERQVSPGASIRFQLSPLHHWPTPDPRTLAQLRLHPYISNWHVGIYDTGSIQGFRKAERMMGREQMPHIKVSGECFPVSRGGVGSFICTNPPVSSCHHSEAHPQSCQVLSQRGGGCLLLGLQSDIFAFSHHPPRP